MIYNGLNRLKPPALLIADESVSLSHTYAWLKKASKRLGRAAPRTKAAAITPGKWSIKDTIKFLL